MSDEAIAAKLAELEARIAAVEIDKIDAERILERAETLSRLSAHIAQKIHEISVNQGDGALSPIESRQ